MNTTSSVSSNPTKIIPFDQIYMANIPNRHLDLSILETKENVDPNIVAHNIPAKHYLDIEKVICDIKCSEPKQTKNYEIATNYDAWFSNRGALDNRSTQFKGINESGITEKNHIIDLQSNIKSNCTNSPNILNINKPVPDHNPPNCSRSANECCCKQHTHNQTDPTVKDLLKIIQQQNEQILILQKQVATLLNNDKGTSNSTEEVPTVSRNFNLFDDKYKTSTQVDTNFCQPSQGFLSKKPTLQQISLDVMTNFEVSIRRPTSHNRMCNDNLNQPKIYEITETGCNSSNRNVLDDVNKPNDSDVNFSLNEPQIQVQERCPTPMNSIQVNMKDYSSDSSDEDTNPSWTFYNNIMGQVNHILKKSGIQPKNLPPNRMDYEPNDRMKQSIMMKKVKKATLKHLKSIGVHIPSTESVQELNSQSMNSPNDISFTVQQLLMKYLPNEQLTKITCNQNDHQKNTQGNIKRRPEFSIATVQYMQKYNLLNDIPSVPVAACEPKLNFDRILDVTAIRQQPKLL